MDEAWLAIDKLTSIVEKTRLDFPIPGWVSGAGDDRHNEVEDDWEHDRTEPVTQITITHQNGPSMKAKRQLHTDITTALSAIVFDIKQSAGRFHDKERAREEAEAQAKKIIADAERRDKEEAAARAKREKDADKKKKK